MINLYLRILTDTHNKIFKLFQNKLIFKISTNFLLFNGQNRIGERYKQ